MNVDLLDYVIDNTAERRREIWRGGRLVATCPADYDAIALAYFGATGPFGTYPDAPAPRHSTGDPRP